MAWRQLSNKIGSVIKTLNETRDEFTLATAKDAHVLTVARVQDQGKDYTDKKMPLYSRKNMPYWLLNPSKFNAPGKVQTFKDKAKKGQVEPSYHGLRQELGMPVNMRTLTFSGGMFSSIDQEVTQRTNTTCTVTIKGKDQFTQDLIGWNSNKVKANILQFGEKEKQLVRKVLKKRIENIYKAAK